jgi:hypothetical protein
MRVAQSGGRRLTEETLVAKTAKIEEQFCGE